jgi:hypothetical protein
MESAATIENRLNNEAMRSLEGSRLSNFDPGLAETLPADDQSRANRAAACYSVSL